MGTLSGVNLLVKMQKRNLLLPGFLSTAASLNGNGVKNVKGVSFNEFMAEP